MKLHSLAILCLIAVCFASDKKNCCPQSGSSNSAIPAVTKTVRFTGLLNGNSLSPPVNTSASGNISLSFNTVTNTLSYVLFWNGIPLENFNGAFLYPHQNTSTSSALVTLAPFRSKSPYSASNVLPDDVTPAGKAALRNLLLGSTNAFVQIEVLPSLSGLIGGAISRVVIDEVPVLTEVRPYFGFISGGKQVTVYGSNFVNVPELECQFGDIGSTQGAWINSTRITCITPVATSSREVPIRVSNDGIKYSLNSVAFSYLLPVPKITSVYPTNAVRYGGTHVTVFGSNFTRSVGRTPVCDFGGVSVAAVQISTAGNYIICISPQLSSSGPILMRVSNDNIAFSTSVAFTIDEPAPVMLEPVLSNIQPSSVSLNSGAKITVRGANFVDGPLLMCMFSGLGSTPAKVLVQSGGLSLVECATPTLSPPAQVPPNPINVRLTNDGNTYSNPVPLTVLVPAPSVFSVRPSPLFNTGGQSLIVSGANFMGLNLTCHFGGIRTPASLDANSHYSVIKCPAPALLAGNTTFQVSNNGVNRSNNLVLAVVSVPVPSVTKVYPSASVADQTGSLITVLGNNFVYSPSLVCVFGNVTVPATPLYNGVDNAITCRVPNTTTLGSVAFSVQNDVRNSSTRSTEKFSFTYTSPVPIITSISPELAVKEGGTLITVTGQLFYNSSMTCSFETGSTEVFTPATYVNPTTVVCPSPQLSAGNYSFRLNVGVEAGSTISSSPKNFVALNAPIPAVTSLSASSVDLFTASLITVVGSGFTQATSIRFTDTSGQVFSLQPTRVINSTVLVLAMPILNTPGTASMQMTNDGLYYGRALNVTYRIPTPTFSQNISTPTPSVEGNSQVMVTGSGFYSSSNLACLWSVPSGNSLINVTSSATYVNSTLVICVSPRTNTSGVGSLRIVNSPTIISAPLQVNFTWPLPFVYAYSPASSPIEGNMLVTLRLARSLPLIPSCRFGQYGTVNATVLVINGETQYQCLSPHSGEPADIQIEVSNDGVNFVKCCRFSFAYNFGTPDPKKWTPAP